MYQDVCLHMLWPLCILVYAYDILIAIIYLSIFNNRYNNALPGV